MFVNDVQLESMGNMQLPKKVSNTNEISGILKESYLKFNNVEDSSVIQGGAKRTYGFQTTVIGFILITDKMYSHQYNV